MKEVMIKHWIIILLGIFITIIGTLILSIQIIVWHFIGFFPSYIIFSFALTSFVIFAGIAITLIGLYIKYRRPHHMDEIIKTRKEILDKK